MHQHILLVSVVLLLLDGLVMYSFDSDSLIELIPLFIIAIIVDVMVVSKFKIQSFPYIDVISGLVSLLLAIIYLSNPTSDSELLVLSAIYAFYFGVVSYTFGFVYLFVYKSKNKIPFVLNIIGIITASPWILFAGSIRYYLG